MNVVYEIDNGLVDEVMQEQILSLHKDLTGKLRARKLPGEFNNDEYARTVKMSPTRTRYLLNKAVEEGYLTLRKVGRYSFYKFVEGKPIPEFD